MERGRETPPRGCDTPRRVRWVQFTIAPLAGIGDDMAREPSAPLRTVSPRRWVAFPWALAATPFGSFTNETYFGRTDGRAHCTGRADRASRNQRDCGLDIRQSNLGARLKRAAAESPFRCVSDQPWLIISAIGLGSRRNRRCAYRALPPDAAKRVLIPVSSPSAISRSGARGSLQMKRGRRVAGAKNEKSPPNWPGGQFS